MSKDDIVWSPANPSEYKIGNATVSTSSTLVIPANKKSKHRTFTNISANLVFLSPGVPAEMNKGFPLYPNGGVYQCSAQEGNNIHLAMYGISSGSSVIAWAEGE